MRWNALGIRGRVLFVFHLSSRLIYLHVVGWRVGSSSFAVYSEPRYAVLPIFVHFVGAVWMERQREARRNR